jgi:plastocyanin
MRRQICWLAIAAVSAGPFASTLAGCFSERDGGTGPAEGECTFPLNDEIAGSTVVVMTRFTFRESEVRVPVGGRVSWVNCDLESHTSTEDDGGWNSPLLDPGTAFTQTFATAGTFTYHCEPHPFMTGRVIVE